MTREVPGVRPYRNPAGGWGALRAVARTVREQMDVADASRTLLRTNQPDGFDCPGCAWPDKTSTSTFQFCENGAKAVTWEATRKRVTPDFFAQHTVSSLLKWTDFQLEGEGRITHPMTYDASSDTYQPIEWSEAFQLIGVMLRALPDPNAAEFYTSGRASNEAAFSTSCSRASSAPTISPTVRICVTKRRASACRSRSASAKAPCPSTTSTAASS